MDEVKWYESCSLESIKNIIKDNINTASRSFVAIGYYLKNVRDRELYLEDGYQSIWEFAQGEFGIGKSSSSRFMAINDRFSKDGNSPILLEQYKDFSSSKLSEMLTMTDEQLEHISITTTRAEIREIKQADKGVAPAQQKTVSEIHMINPSGKCIHRSEFACTLPEAAKLATLNGENCSSSCCWNCEKHSGCGYECNSSAHRHIVNEQSEVVVETNETVIKELESVIPEKECGNCNYNDMDPDKYREDHPGTKEFPCNNCDDKLNHWMPKIEGFNHPVDELEEIETVEADIIQRVPEEDETQEAIDPEHYTCQDIRDELNKLIEYVGMYRKNNDTAPGRRKAKMRLDAMVLLDEEMRKPPVIEESEPVQPELPILKNNDQRKEWAENYKSWGEWYYDENIDCHYYKYDFPNGDRLVVEEYLERELYWGKDKRDSHFFHLLQKEKLKYEKNKTYENKYEHDTTSMTEIVEYLKEIQKKGES